MCPLVKLDIRPGGLDRPETLRLIEEHLCEMHQFSPPESVHAFDAEKLAASELSFWTAWSEERLAGIAAMKELDSSHGEIKSMRTSRDFLRRGVARTLLNHLLATAKSRGYDRVSLETGSMIEFAPARRLYDSFGFTYCAPFADYCEDRNSVFMTLLLSQSNS